MQDKKIADWATVDADVWVRMDSYGRIARYRAGKITRITKSSVFVKLEDGTLEYRFTGVDNMYTTEPWPAKGEEFMNEYGARGDIYGWRGRKHLYAGDSEHVANDKVRADRDELEQKARAAALRFGSGNLIDKSRYEEGKAAVAAIEAWLAVVPEDEQ